MLSRVGRLLGAAQGTGPDNDPFLRGQRSASPQRASALRVLKSRGVAVSVSPCAIGRKLAAAAKIAPAGADRVAGAGLVACPCQGTDQYPCGAGRSAITIGSR